MIFQAIMSSTSLANPYYVSLDKSWWNQAKDLWNKYGGGTDYERHMLERVTQTYHTVIAAKVLMMRIVKLRLMVRAMHPRQSVP